MSYKPHQLSIRADKELAEDLDALADAAHRSRSDFIRLALQAEVDRQRKAGNLPPRKAT